MNEYLLSRWMHRARAQKVWVEKTDLRIVIIHLAQFQARVEGSVRRLRREVRAKTEPYIMHQNKNKDPAKEPTDSGRESRRINQKCVSCRRNGSRRAANDVKPSREKKELKQKRGLGFSDRKARDGIFYKGLLRWGAKSSGQ